jgi:hypothetical protein
MEEKRTRMRASRVDRDRSIRLLLDVKWGVSIYRYGC